MPYIKRQASIINGADACGAGMKKAGIASRMGWSRIPNSVFKSSTPQKVPTFKLTCCSARGRGSDSMELEALRRVR
jgi:hypothetical protein